MNPRLYIAAHALQGLLAHGECERIHGCNLMCRAEEIAGIAVQYADALIAQLHKTSPAAAASPSVPPAETAARGQGGR